MTRSFSDDAAHRRELEESTEAVRSIMAACEDNAAKSKAIFKKVVPQEKARWLERYRKAVQAVMPNKKLKVEDLMKDVLEKLQLLHTNHF
ncbi:hypothetical protein MMC07_008190 [Pseudocyphellaria aurata]|nr:hypothetical protein [Pseudocyphellaria aurata]